MSQVVDRSAELTAFRARDMLDATLAAALRDLLRPQQVSIHRCVGEDADKRWMTRARLRLDDAAPASDPPWTALHQLPPLADFLARLQALRQQVVVVLAGPPHTAVFPLTTDRDVVGVLEIGSAQALDGDAHRRVGSILRIHCNFQALLDDSERDTLTGLLNRKTFDEAFYKLAAGIDIGMPPPMSGCAAASRPTPSRRSAASRCRWATSGSSPATHPARPLSAPTGRSTGPKATAATRCAATPSWWPGVSWGTVPPSRVMSRCSIRPQAEDTRRPPPGWQARRPCQPADTRIAVR